MTRLAGPPGSLPAARERVSRDREPRNRSVDRANLATPLGRAERPTQGRQSDGEPRKQYTEIAATFVRAALHDASFAARPGEISPNYIKLTFEIEDVGGKMIVSGDANASA
jgi:hypothetical protein